jgi:Ca2+-binding RTX toxin-like protein
LLLGALAVPAVAASGQTTLPLCFGKSATIVGGQYDDYIAGTRGDDVILVRHTDAFVEGKRGADRICGGGFTDYLHGGGGRDRIKGGGTLAVADDLSGGRGSDILRSPGDQLQGGGGADKLIGGRGGNMFGNGGNDLLKVVDTPYGSSILEGGGRRRHPSGRWGGRLPRRRCRGRPAWWRRWR